MNDAMIGFIGVIAGSGLSLVGTIIALRHERKLSSESDLRKFEFSKQEWLRNEKTQIYVEFTSILEKIDIFCTKEIMSYTIERESFKLYRNLIENYIDNNSGKLALYLPYDIHSEIVNFYVKVMRELIEYEDTDTIAEERVDDVLKCIRRIVDIMRKDIGTNKE